MNMNTRCSILLAAVFSITLASAHAQIGMGPGGASGPSFGGATAALFGKNSNFTATVELQVKGATPEPASMPGKLTVASGFSRFELDTSEIKGGGMPEGAAAQMKSMGMDKMIMVTRPDKKLTYLIYPGLQSYAEMALQDPEAAMPASDFKVELTELGKETVDSHACVKNKAVVTDTKGVAHTANLWNATDLKNFPVKIEQSEGNTEVTMLFKNVKLEKPDAALFDPPKDNTRYESIQAMIQQVMLKRFSGGAAGAVPQTSPKKPEEPTKQPQP
jgi:hypothetical protein